MDSNMEIFALKDALWKLTARVAVIENVITEKFGAGVFSVLPSSFTSVEPQINRKTNNKKRKSLTEKEKISLVPLNEVRPKRVRVRNTLYCEDDFTLEGEDDASDSQTVTQKATEDIIKVEDEDYEPDEDDDEEADEEQDPLFQTQTPLSKSSHNAVRGTGCTSASEKEEQRNQSTYIDSKASGVKPEKIIPVVNDDNYEYVLRRKKNARGPQRPRTGGRKKDDIWLSFTKDEKCENPDVGWRCNTCNKQIGGNATRMKRHKMKCDAKQQNVKIKPLQKSKDKQIPAPTDTSHNPSQQSDPGQIVI